MDLENQTKNVNPKGRKRRGVIIVLITILLLLPVGFGIFFGALASRGFFHEHEYELAETIAPTCELPGKNIYVCKGDPEHTYSDVIPALGHNYEEQVKDSTCVSEGERKTVCLTCGYIRESFVIFEKEHTLKEIVTPSTCTTEGEIVTVCEVCNQEFGRETIVVKAHQYEESGTHATCLLDGLLTYTCTECGDSYSISEKATGHHNQPTKYVAPTCTAAGKSEFACKDCGESVSYWLPAKGHSADFAEKGYCTVCKAINHAFWNSASTYAFVINTETNLYNIWNCKATESEIISVPSFYNGEKIDRIGDLCYANCAAVKEVYVPETITDIGDMIFKGLTQEITVYYGGSLQQWENALASRSLTGGVDDSKITVVCAK